MTGSTVNLSGITIRNGSSGSGLIVERPNTVNFSQGAVRDISSSQRGGGINNAGTLRLTDVEITGNSLPEFRIGGGATAAGGGIYNTGRLSVDRSLIANNFATRGGGIYNSGGGRLDLENSTVSGNTTLAGGGGLHNQQDAIANISFSTIVDNEANQSNGFLEREDSLYGGGILNISGGQINMNDSIVARNMRTIGAAPTIITDRIATARSRSVSPHSGTT